MFYATGLHILYSIVICVFGPQDDKGSGARHRENVRTRSSSRQHRTKYPTAAVAAGPDNNSRQINSLRDYLVQKPTDIFKTLLHAGLTVVQAGMDTFGDVSARVYRTITPDRQPYSDTRQRSTDGSKPSNPGLVQTVAKSVVNMVGTGISGMKEVTDLGLLLGNIGTQKIRSKLNGDTGNQEIFQMLIKYVGTYIENIYVLLFRVLFFFIILLETCDTIMQSGVSGSK